MTKGNVILPREKALVLYRMMARTRALFEVMILHRQEIFGTFLSGLGMEAIAAGAAFALYDKGILLESPKHGDHRTMWGFVTALCELGKEVDHVHSFELMKNFMQKQTSLGRGRDGNVHWGCLACNLLPWMCSDMGRPYPVLVGMAEELARKKEWRELPPAKRPVGIAMFGEGADQQGCVSETNSWIAASNCVRSDEELKKYEKFLDDLSRTTKVLRGSPVIHVVVCNQRSIYTDPADEHGNSDLAKRALGYGNMVGIDVDGDDAEAVYRVVTEAIERAQNLQSTRIIAHTYRRTGHNEDQIQRDVQKLNEAREAFTSGDWDFEPDWTDGKIIDVDPDEFKAQWQREPLRVYRARLLQGGTVGKEDLASIMRNARKEMWELYQKAKLEPDVTVRSNEENLSLLPPHPSWGLPLEVSPTASSRKLKYQDAYIEVVGELLREDERATFFGQDVRTGGVLFPTRRLAEDFGPLRIFNAPIVEEAIHSVACGRALAGGRPIIEGQQFATFFSDAFPSILTVVSQNWYQKKMKFSLINILPSGVVRSGGSGPYHETWVEAYLHHMLGITIVAPADAYDLLGLMRAAHEYDGPVAMILQIAAATDPQFESRIPEERYVIPLGKAKVKREGKDFTVVVYGAACVRAALNEAEHLSEEGISVEVVDLRTVWPPDWETIRASVKKTGRFTIMHEDWKDGGIGQTIKAGLLEGRESVLPYIKTPTIEVVAAKRFPPIARVLVWDNLPYEIEEADEKDEKGRPVKTRIHRSSRLASVIRDAMEY